MRSAPSPPLPWLLALAVLLGRAARWAADGRLVDISHEAQVGLARAVAGPQGLDLVLGGVHPGWAKAPLHPLLAAGLGAVLGDARLASVALTWLYAAALVPLCAALGRRLWGDRAGLVAALAVGALPALGVDLREYALAAALLLGAAVLALRALGGAAADGGDEAAGPPSPRGGWGAAAAAGALLGLSALARWEAPLWCAVVLAAWAVAARRGRGGRGVAGAAVAAGVGAAGYALVQALAWPTSSFSQRLAERLALNAIVAGSFGGQALDQVVADGLHAVGSDGAALQTAPAGDFAATWMAALPGVAVALADTLLHPLGWPVWGLALVGAGALGRRGPLVLVGALLPALAVSFMPTKAGYLVLPGCALALLAGRGAALLSDRAAPVACGLLAAATLGSLVRGRLDPELSAHLARQHEAAAAARVRLPAGAPLLAQEDLCVLLMDRHPCTFLPPDLVPGPAGDAARAWVARQGPSVALIDDTVPGAAQALDALATGPPTPLADGWATVPLGRAPP